MYQRPLWALKVLWWNRHPSIQTSIQCLFLYGVRVFYYILDKNTPGPTAGELQGIWAREFPSTGWSQPAGQGFPVSGASLTRGPRAQRCVQVTDLKGTRVWSARPLLGANTGGTGIGQAPTHCRSQLQQPTLGQGQLGLCPWASGFAFSLLWAWLHSISSVTDPKKYRVFHNIIKYFDLMLSNYFKTKLHLGKLQSAHMFEQADKEMYLFL